MLLLIKSTTKREQSQCFAPAEMKLIVKELQGFKSSTVLYYLQLLKLIAGEMMRISDLGYLNSRVD